jgi:hypothetical protein
MVSMPSSLARVTTCAARMPVSTLIIRVTPCAAAVSTTSGRMP